MTITGKSLARAVFEQKQADLEAQARQSQNLDSLARVAGGFAREFNDLLMILSGASELPLPKLHFLRKRPHPGFPGTLLRSCRSFAIFPAIRLTPWQTLAGCTSPRATLASLPSLLLLRSAASLTFALPQ
jgi:hypothetical protein